MSSRATTTSILHALPEILFLVGRGKLRMSYHVWCHTIISEESLEKSPRGKSEESGITDEHTRSVSCTKRTHMLGTVPSGLGPASVDGSAVVGRISGID